MAPFLQEKNILITGGSGSIGQALIRKAIDDKAKLIRVFSNDENGLYEIESKLGKKHNLEFVIGDIRDEDTVSEIVKGMDIVYHAAALKHVDRCELYPFEAMTVNVIGTKNVTKASLRAGVKKLVLISTDKAVNPIGVMGATKLLSEKLVSAEAFHNKSGTVFASVRFGNVFNTRGSIIPRIESQIKAGGPITLTDPRMKRFFMTIDDAVNLIISATVLAKGGETFVLKMPLLQLGDLFEAMKQVMAPRYGYKADQIKTKVIGIRPGEKLIEYLLTPFEMEHVLETDQFFIIPPLNESIKRSQYKGARKPKDIMKHLENLEPLKKDEIVKILKSIY